MTTSAAGTALAEPSFRTSCSTNDRLERNQMSTIGTVTFLSTERAFAFVSPADGRELFLHLSRVAVERRAAVAVGERVEYERAVRAHPSQASR